jgi:hypothetical protein
MGQGRIPQKRSVCHSFQVDRNLEVYMRFISIIVVNKQHIRKGLRRSETSV